jgi:hypothetical protein
VTAAEIVRAAAADGVRLTIVPPETVKAIGKPEAVQRWAPKIREHKAALIREDRIERLRPYFVAVLSAFHADTSETALAWSLALKDLDAAELSFVASAAMIRAGWKPLEEQAAAFLQRAARSAGAS